MTGDDELLLDLSKQEGWKQCPSCSILIELRSGCNHITCQNCTEEFCYRCLKPWSKDNGMCSSGECEVWDEDRLVEAGEARVQQLEAARGGRIFPERIRQERMARAVAALRANETCQHEWGRRDGYHGECESCTFELHAYAMICGADCGSTVCYTCAHHRLPGYGWN